MEIDNDGPKSPDVQSKQIQSSTTNIDYDDAKLDDKCKNLLKKLEPNQSNNNTMNDDEQLQIALLLQNFYENNLYVQIKLFEFYTSKNLEDFATNLLNKLIKFHSFIDTSIFDRHLYLIAQSIIFKELHIQIEPLTGEKMLEFYFKIFKNQSIRTQEKYLIQILDKFKLKFSLIFKLSANDVKPSVAEIYSDLLENECELELFKYLLKIHPKYIQIYAIQLIDSILHLEKQLLFNNSHRHRHHVAVGGDDDTMTGLNDDEVNNRSLNLLRKLCVIDFIYEYIVLVDKLDNKIYYRWIEKSLEFFCKLTLYSFDYVRSASDSDRSFNVKYNQVDLLLDLEDNSLKQLKQKYSQSKLLKINLTNDELWLQMFCILDEISKKLDWPTTVLPTKTDNKIDIQKIKLESLLHLRQQQQAQPQSKQAIDSNKLTKQISFYGISIFLYELIKLNKLLKCLFANKLQLCLNGNDGDDVYRCDTGNRKTVLLEKLDYILKLWSKLNEYKDICNIVTKCLNNCKLDTLYLIKEFYYDFFYFYKYSINKQYIEELYAESMTSTGLFDLKQRIQFISYLFVEKSLYQESLNQMRQLLKDLRHHEKATVHNESLYIHNYAPNLDLFRIDYKSSIKYFSKLILTKMWKKFLSDKNFISTFNDTYKGHLLVLIQVYKATQLYNLLFNSVKHKKIFKYEHFFTYVYGEYSFESFPILVTVQRLILKFKDIQVLEDFAYFTNVSEMKLVLDDMDDYNLKRLKECFVNQVNSTKCEGLYENIHDFLDKYSSSICQMLMMMHK